MLWRRACATAALKAALRYRQVTVTLRGSVVTPRPAHVRAHGITRQVAAAVRLDLLPRLQ